MFWTGQLPGQLAFVFFSKLLFKDVFTFYYVYES